MLLLVALWYHSIDDSLLRLLLLSCLAPALLCHAKVDDLDRLVVHEDVYVQHVAAKLEQLISNHVQVNLRVPRQLRVLHQGEVLLHLFHFESR